MPHALWWIVVDRKIVIKNMIVMQQKLTTRD